MALLVACVVGACSSADPVSTARHDGVATTATVVTNAEVYTVNAERSWAEAFAYDNGGTITAVGSEAEVMARAGKHPRVIDAGGHMVLPGFQDPHLHVPEAGINEAPCFMDPDQTLAEYEKRAAECANDQPGSGWVRAAGASLFNLRDATELPIGTIERAVTRETEAVPDVAAAIELVTINAAYALGHDDNTGSIEVGKFADYIIVNQNLLDIDLEDIHTTKVLLTVLAGKQTHRSPRFTGVND